MKLTSIETMKILDDAKLDLKNERWIKHSICVGNTAGRIAKTLDLDEDFTKVLGYIHDIGKINGYQIDRTLKHEIKGYNYIKELGYDEEYASICITHSYLNNDLDCVSGDKSNKNDISYDFLKNYVENHIYSDYDKLINLCDLMCTDRVMTMEKRLIDLLIRHGVFETTQYHIKEALKLKEYFDNLLGYNLYNIFPEIKENL